MPDRESISDCEIHNPVDRFAHLPEPTRKFLEQLREEDIKDILEAARAVKSTKTFGKVMRWSIISVVGFFVAASQFGEAVTKLLHWMNLGGRQ